MPSNRSEAWLVAWNLAKRLSEGEGRLTYRQELEMHMSDLIEPDPDVRRGDGSVVVDAWFDEVNWSRLFDAEEPSPLQLLAAKRFNDVHGDDGELEAPDWDGLAENAPAAAEGVEVEEGDTWKGFADVA